MPIPANVRNALFENRVEAIKQAHRDANTLRAELDLSGGIDSLVMAFILVTALGPENVTLVHSRFSTNPKQSARAKAIAEALDTRLVDANLGEVFTSLLEEFWSSLREAGYDIDEIDARVEADPTILGSIRSTLRAPIGRAYNRLTGGGLRHGTGNECEDRWLRFYQKGGDGEVDSNPIAMLSKGEVYQLAWWLSKRFPAAADVIQATIQATPSPDLWGTGDGHSDEAELLSWLGVPFTYSRIDIETGDYSSVGTIERVSRFLDLTMEPGLDPKLDGTAEDYLFHSESGVPAVSAYAINSGLFDEFSRSEVEAFLLAARRAEAQTRHKMNPNCPMYGSREELVRLGILTNDLPEVARG